jgi:hypothetical protein
MFLTLLQSGGSPPPPPPPPPTGGGPGGPGSYVSARRPSPAHEWELELVQAARLAAIAKELEKSDRPQARRIARKVADYTGEIRQVESLRRELAKLEAAQRERVAQTLDEIERDRELRAAINELDNILLEEEDAIQAFLQFEEIEARFLMSALGIKIN